MTFQVIWIKNEMTQVITSNLKLTKQTNPAWPASSNSRKRNWSYLPDNLDQPEETICSPLSTMAELQGKVSSQSLPQAARECTIALSIISPSLYLLICVPVAQESGSFNNMLIVKCKDQKFMWSCHENYILRKLILHFKKTYSFYCIKTSERLGTR